MSPRSLARAAGISKGRAQAILEGTYPSRNLTEAMRRKLIDYLAGGADGRPATVTDEERRPSATIEQKAAAFDLIAGLVQLLATSPAEAEADAPVLLRAARSLRTALQQQAAETARAQAPGRTGTD